MEDFFRKFSHKMADILGSFWAFFLSFAIIIVWLLIGPIFNFSDSWQLVINTGTTIVTFLMVFIIQNTQNRDAKAIHLKLDELIKSQKTARNYMIDLENLSDEELKQMQSEFEVIYQKSKYRKERIEAKSQPNNSANETQA